MASRINDQKAEIEGICKRLGITAAQLGERAAIKPETMRKISRGYQAASAILMQSIRNVETLHNSIKKNSPVAKGHLFKEGHANTSEKKIKLRKVPVVSWASAGAAHDYSDMSEQIDQEIDTNSTDANAFALILEGDSMMPRFEAGDIVIFEPSSEPRNGDFVVARLREDQGVLFKKFRRTGAEGKIICLESLNPNYKKQEFPETDFHFIYPAVEFKGSFRRRL